MRDVDPQASKEPRPSRNWLPSRGCRVAVTLLLGLALVCFWIDWRGRPERARLQSIEQLGGEIRTTAAGPVWLHDLVVALFGEGHAVGLADVAAVDLDHTQVTDADLQLLSDLRGGNPKPPC